MSINKWDERYREEQFAYGTEPNLFFKEWLSKFEPGAILMPAEGEGRNGVYAAQQGWTVTAFDQSAAGRAKALLLAKERGVAIEYVMGDLDVLDFDKDGFDAIGLIYAHVDSDKKAAFHKKLDTYLKPGGVVIFEAFSKTHLRYNSTDPRVGGPKDIDMLYSKNDIIDSFGNYEILVLEEVEIELSEGEYHNGKGSVVRFVGRKN